MTSDVTSLSIGITSEQRRCSQRRSAASGPILTRRSSVLNAARAKLVFVRGVARAFAAGRLRDQGPRQCADILCVCVCDLWRKWPRLRVARRWKRNGCAPYRRSPRTNDPYRGDRFAGSICITTLLVDGVARVEQQNSFHAASACYNLAAPIRPPRL